MLREGHIVQEIVTAAREGEFDLIVIGAKGRSKIKEILLGSICEKVVRNAPCNVMVVK
jgi:nucleotide-binding universal stress UspA family protein